MGMKRRAGQQKPGAIPECCSRIRSVPKSGPAMLGTGIAVAYVDALPEGLSAIHCYYDPTEGARSLGTSNIVKVIIASSANH